MTHICRLFAALLLCALPAVPAAAEPEKQKKLTPTECYEQVLTDIETRSLVRLPNDWQKYRAVKPANTKELLKALHDAVAAARHPQLTIVTAREAADIKAAQQGGCAGIGCTVGLDAVVMDGLRIKEVLSDTYAEEAGLLVGDIIVSADGQTFDGWSFQRIVTKLIKGEPGTKVSLGISRDGGAVTINVERDVESSLGVVAEPVQKSMNFIIGEVQRGTPAEKAGVQEGDILVAVDGVSSGAIALNNAPGDIIRNGPLGTKVKLELLREDKPLTVEVERTAITYGEKQTMTAMQKSGKDGWWQVRAKNFDWKELVASIDNGIKEHGDMPLVLDLRGASGDDLDIAVQLLARFSKFNNPTIHAEVQTANGRKLESVAGGIPPKRYTGKLTILVDGTTSGTAEVIPWILVESKTAEVRGQMTAGRACLVTVKSYELEDGSSVNLSMPDRVITYADKPMPKTYPTVYENDVSQKLNFQDIASKKARGDADGDYKAVTGYAFLAIVILVAIVLICAALSRSKVCVSEPSLRNPLPGEVKVEETQSAVRTYTSWIPVVLVLLTALAAGVFFWWRGEKAPASGEVVVTVFTDDSPLSKAQEKVLTQLKSEYSGTIRFESKAAADQQDVSHAPAVRVSTLWYDAEGKTVASICNQGGARTKRDLVKDIERAVQAERENGRKPLSVVRTKAVRP